MTRDRINTDTFDDAYDTVAAAAALGMNVPAIPGTLIYSALVVWSEGRLPRMDFLGTYATYKAAVDTVVAWVTNEWDSGYAQPPWDHEDADYTTRTEWLNHATETDILDWYFQDHPAAADWIVYETPIRATPDLSLLED